MKRLFGMVTTKSSSAYTAHALASFFQTTPLTPGEKFFLIDNDGAFPAAVLEHFRSHVTLITNQQPLSFAANANQILRRAQKEGADFYFLNNDVIFSSKWWEPFSSNNSAILCPLSNRDVNYSTNILNLSTVMTLPDFIGREQAFEFIAEEHRKRFSGYQDYLVAPFFAVKIPRVAYEAIGEFDESFGAGGGEDYDYCLRSYLAGFPVRVAMGSYLLHFGGKSSWDGAETKDEQLERERLFFSRFREKWGEQLFEVVLKENHALVSGSALDTQAKECLEKRDFKGIIELLSPGCGA